MGAALPGVMNLTSATATFTALVNVTSLDEPAFKRVLPGDPTNSYIIHKLEGTSASARACHSEDRSSTRRPSTGRAWIRRALRGWGVESAGSAGLARGLNYRERDATDFACEPDGSTCSWASALLGAGPAAAGGRWSGVLAATTDYVYRGVSQTHNQPALQGDVHYETAGSLVVGLWASTVQPTSNTPALELDAYLGQSWLLADDLLLSLTTAVHYAYLDTSKWGPKDYDEILASLGYRGLLFANVASSSERSAPLDFQ